MWKVSWLYEKVHNIAGLRRYTNQAGRQLASQ